MANGQISGKAFTLESLFGGRTTYKLEYYQREYAWSANDVGTLLSDLIEEFERADKTHRPRRGAPPQYFLGPFVYTEEDGSRFLVDGQQRFTTLHLIFLHLFRLIPDGSPRKTEDRLSRAIIAGYRGRDPWFRLDIPERQKPLEALLDGREYEMPSRGASLSVQTLWKRSSQIEEELHRSLDSERHGRFVDWLLDNVVLVGIEAVDRNNGFRIFESMNDRGARLTSVDLVKSYLLSRANRDEEKLNESWREMLAEVTRKRGDTDAPKDFLKAFLVARYADIGEDSHDAEEIDLTPHEWIRTNAERIGLEDDDGETYHNFVSELLEISRHYGDLAAATLKPYHDNELAALFYNRVNGLTAQMALILACVHPQDTPSTVQQKARVASNFVDILYVTRAVYDESTRPDDLNREIRQVVPRIRSCRSAADLGAILGEQLPPLDLDVLQTFFLRGDNRAQVRYLLARLTAYVQKEMGRPDEIEQYLSTDRVWQIEHVFANHPERYPELTPHQFRILRGRFGGLGLLHASDNASVRDLPFAEKVAWYRSRNTLLAAMAPGYDNRNPTFRTLRKSHGLDGVLRTFGTSPSIEEVVNTRGRLYQLLAARIWDPGRLGLVISSDEAVPESSPRKKADRAPSPSPRHSSGRRRPRRTELATLVAEGRIRPGLRLHGIYRGTRHEARVDADGRLWLDDTWFRLPDEAERIVTDRKKCAGWRFWNITLKDGTAVPLGKFRDDPTLKAG